MAIDYAKLAQKMETGVWYTGDELTALWKVSGIIRKARAKRMVAIGLLKRLGKTADVKYCRPLPKQNLKPAAPIKPFEMPKPNSLDSLIAAASRVGTENEILKSALHDAKAAIERAFEAIK